MWAQTWVALISAAADDMAWVTKKYTQGFFFKFYGVRCVIHRLH